MDHKVRKIIYNLMIIIILLIGNICESYGSISVSSNSPVMLGEDLMLHCDYSKVADKSSLSITWMYRRIIAMQASTLWLFSRNFNVDVKQDPTWEIYRSNVSLERIHSIFLPNVTLSSGGFYFCHAEYMSGSEFTSLSDHVNVEIYVPPTPKILIDGESIDEFLQYNITCQIKHIKPVNDLRIVFFNGSEMIGPELEMNEDKLTFNAFITVKYLASRYDDGKDLICVVSWNGQRYKSSLKLNIRFPPEKVYMSSQGAVAVGSNITLSCIALSSNPPTKIHWENISEKYVSVTHFPDGYHGTEVQSTIHMTASIAMDKRRITCIPEYNGSILSDGIKSTILNVTYAPTSVEMFANSIELMSDSLLNFTCTANAGNPPFYQYRWKHKAVYAEDYVFIKGEHENTLLRDKVTSNDAGSYQCEVSNHGGTNSADQFINIRYGPILINPEQNTSVIFVDAFDDFSLSVHIQSEPAPLICTWTFTGNGTRETIPDGTIINLKEYLYECQLRRASFGHGLYKCFVSNYVGRNLEVEIDVKPYGPPEAPTNLTVLRATTRIILSWVPGANGGHLQEFVIEYWQLDNFLEKIIIKGIEHHSSEESVNFTIDRLEVNTEYAVQITACSIKGETKSEAIEFKTRDAPLMSKIHRKENLGPKVALSWTPPRGFYTSLGIRVCKNNKCTIVKIRNDQIFYEHNDLTADEFSLVVYQYGIIVGEAVFIEQSDTGLDMDVNISSVLLALIMMVIGIVISLCVFRYKYRRTVNDVVKDASVDLSEEQLEARVGQVTSIINEESIHPSSPSPCNLNERYEYIDMSTIDLRNGSSFPDATLNASIALPHPLRQGSPSLSSESSSNNYPESKHSSDLSNAKDEYLRPISANDDTLRHISAYDPLNERPPHVPTVYLRLQQS